MANETTTASAGDSQFPKWFDARIAEERRPLNVMRPFFKYRGPEHAPTYRFTFLGDPGVAATKAEGSAMTNTQLSTSGADVTVGTIGMQATITDEHDESALYSTFGTYGPQLMRSLAEKFETDATALLGGFSNTSGTSGADLTLQVVMEAGIALAGRDVTGMGVLVLHTRQVGDLKIDASTSTAAVYANPGMTVDNIAVDSLGGYQGVFAGFPTFQTSLVPTANGGADRAGALFIVDDALGLYEIRPPKSETQRELGVGLGVAVTQRFGVGEIRDDGGQSILTDA